MGKSFSLITRKRFVFSVCLLLHITIISTDQLLAQSTDSCNCATITFETIPGDSVYEGLEINSQYSDSLGMTFMLEDSTFPHIADVGGAKTAFESKYGDDTPAPDQNIGSFFLTDDGKTSGLSSSPLLIQFSIPVDSASGVMLDIDASESFTVQARGDTGQILSEYTIKAGDPGTGDGLATPWSVKRDSADIYSIRLEGKRTQAGFFGLGFDNFTSCSTLRINSIKRRLSPGAQPVSFKLFPNYPNPFNPVTNIEFEIPNSEFVTLKIFNVEGKEVKTLISDMLNPGTYTYQFDGSRLASGIYYYQLSSASYHQARKMILLK
jgi:hypothetical protein